VVNHRKERALHQKSLWNCKWAKNSFNRWEGLWKGCL